MTSFIERLAGKGIFPLYGYVSQGEQCRTYVYKMQDGTGQKVAVKLIPWNSPLVRVDPPVLTHFTQNPFPDGSVVYREVWEDVEGIAIRMDDHQWTLRNWIGGDSRLTQYDWLQIMFGIANNLVHAHGQGQVHGDLKPSNVLVDLGPNNQFDWQGIHITDFGIQYLTRVQLPPEPGCLPTTGCVPGTYSYWAPEIQFMTQCQPTSQSDMWALGCIGYEMCMGQKLSYYNNRLAIDNFSRGGLLDLSGIDQMRFTPEVKTIIQQCLQLNPMERCTAMQLRDHIQQLLLQPIANGPIF